MAKMTKLQRKQASQKGATTKKARKALSEQVQIRTLLQRGLSTQEIALFLGRDLKAIVKTIRLLTIAPNPIAKIIGLGAVGLDVVDDLVTDRFFADPKRLEAGIRKNISEAIKPITDSVAATNKSLSSLQNQISAIITQISKLTL